MQEVGVDRERRLAALVLGDRDLVLLGERDELLARAQIPFAPGRDHGHVGLERVVGELEADLIVALAGGAVGDGVGADLLGDLDLLLGDERAGDRGAEEIESLILRVRPEHREDVVAHELLAQILDEDVLVLDAEELRLAPRRLELLALAEIGREGHDLAAVGGLQPFEDDRGVEPAGIGEHDLLDGAVGHERLGVGMAAIGQGRRSYRRTWRWRNRAPQPSPQPPSHPGAAFVCNAKRSRGACAPPPCRARAKQDDSSAAGDS